MKVCLVVGARPNFIKAAPLIRAFKKYGIQYELIHTGQHYDKNMSQDFFTDLGIKEPDINLNAWGPMDLPSEAIGRTMIFFTCQMAVRKPDLIMVLGDVNSSLACAIAANKMGIPLAHVEAGERCGDKSMPEEMNRIMIDEMSDYLFFASDNGFGNLHPLAEDEHFYEYCGSYLVGNTMIDQLIHILPSIIDFDAEDYAIVTIHRSANVDNEGRFESICELIAKISEKIKILFPVHPRTRKAFEKYGIYEDAENISFLPPKPYSEFMFLVRNAKFVLTDSGGLQIETSYLNVPCLTLRGSTEWIDTLDKGSNKLIGGKSIDTILYNVDRILNDEWYLSLFKDNPIHDGKASERIAKIIKKDILK